jgi:hypothetical protein
MLPALRRHGLYPGIAREGYYLPRTPGIPGPRLSRVVVAQRIARQIELQLLPWLVLELHRHFVLPQVPRQMFVELIVALAFRTDTAVLFPDIQACHMQTGQFPQDAGHTVHKPLEANVLTLNDRGRHHE